jgi:hypothetical protein
MEAKYTRSRLHHVLWVVRSCSMRLVYIYLYFLMTFKVFLHTSYGLKENFTFFTKCTDGIFGRMQFDGFLLLCNSMNTCIAAL